MSLYVDVEKTLGTFRLSTRFEAEQGKGEQEAGGTTSGTWICARDWGVTLDCGRTVPEDITHVGVRSHYIHILSKEEPAARPNVIECRISRIVEDVFNMVVMVRSVRSPSGLKEAQLRLEMPKAQWEAYAGKNRSGVGDEIRIWIEPHDLLLLS